MNEEALRRARKGAALLDEKVPGWDKRVALNRLDMGLGNDLGPCSCVVAQVARTNFWDGLEKLDLGNDPTPYGFDIDQGVSSEDLTDAWTQIIRERRGEA